MVARLVVSMVLLASRGGTAGTITRGDGLNSEQKRVMLWTTNTLAFTNATERAAWIQELRSVRDVVDVVSPGSYYASATWPHRLMRFPGATEVHSALHTAGFKVQPLVGGIGGSWQNAVFTSPQFIADASAEIKQGGLEGLNFDWEPSTCATESDSFQYADFIRRVREESGGFVTVTFPCLHNACDPVVLTKAASRVIDMQTYGGGGVNGTWSPTAWRAVLRTHVAAVGAAKYGLGVCPSCCMNPPQCNHPLFAEEIATRLRLADDAGVREVDVFSDVEPKSDPYNSSRFPVRSSLPWWTALRKWKQRGLVSRAASTSRSTASIDGRGLAVTGMERPYPFGPFPSGVRFIAAANDSHCIRKRDCPQLRVVAVLPQLSCSAFLALNALLRTVHVQRKSPGPFGWSRLPTVRGCMLARVASSVDCPKRVDRAAT
jgi:hypothetical protein